MTAKQNADTKLNPIQVSLLRLFNGPMSDEETLELQKLLVNHYSGALEEEVTKVVKDKKYTQKDFNNMLSADEEKSIPTKAQRIQKIEELTKSSLVDLSNFKFNRDSANDYRE